MSAIREAREKYFPIKSRVIAVEFSNENSSIDDNLTVPPGTFGTVDHVDDTGTVFVTWDNGSSIGAIYGVDRIKRA